MAESKTPRMTDEDLAYYDETLKAWIKSDPDNILNDGSIDINKFKASDRASLKGDKGDTGYYFTPSVDSAGDLSWTNDGGLTNPATVNIKGPKGDTGDTGADGAKGDDGAKGTTFTPSVSSDGTLSWTNDGGLDNPDPVQIVGADGAAGASGTNGATFTPSVSAAGDLSWSNDKGLTNPSTVNIKGPKGDSGDDGAAGPYFSPTVTENGDLVWSNNGGLTNPSVVNIKGPKGDKGDPGDPAEGAVTGVKGENESGDYRTGDVLLTPGNLGAIPTDDIATDFVTSNSSKVSSAKLTSQLKNTIGWDSAWAHNAVYRGKDLTDQFLDGTLSQNIANGTFYDIYPGDYFYKTITWDGVTYTNTKILILECNGYLNRGDTAVTIPHIVCTVDSLIGKYRMAATNTTAGGFKSSEMWQTTIPKFVIGLKNAFGEAHLVKFRALITNATDTSRYNAGLGTTFATSGWEWVDAWAMLMSNTQVFGFAGFDSSAHDAGEGCTQLAAFRFNPSLTTFNRNWFWLRGVTSSTNFANSNNGGDAGYDGASHAGGAFRPLFLYH